jgi:hypothetical protein
MDAELRRPHNIENRTCENDFSKFLFENRKLQNTYTEYEISTSIYQGETLTVPEKKDTKFILRAFPRKVREILVQYEKPNVGIQFPLDNEIFVSAVKVKNTKKETKDAKRNYNGER